MNTKIKLAVSSTLDRTGLLGVLRRAASSRGGIVLALHRVLPAEERSLCYEPHLVLSEAPFAALLELLRDEYQVVSLAELLLSPRGSGGRPKVAITFDDGWEDNYRVAFPYLLRHQMPATIFACPGLLNTSAMLPEERFARLWNQCASKNRLRPLLADLNHWGMGKRKSLRILGPQRRNWSQELKRLPLTTRLLLLDHLEQRYSVLPASTRRFLTWDEVRIMTRTGLITVESHTARHSTLTSESDRDARRELEDSRTAIFERTGITPRFLAYPNGRGNRRVMDLTRSVGFIGAFSTVPGLVTAGTNPLSIPRVGIDDTTVTNTRSQLSSSRTSAYFFGSWLRSAFSF